LKPEAGYNKFQELDNLLAGLIDSERLAWRKFGIVEGDQLLVATYPIHLNFAENTFRRFLIGLKENGSLHKPLINFSKSNFEKDQLLEHLKLLSEDYQFDWPKIKEVLENPRKKVSDLSFN